MRKFVFVLALLAGGIFLPASIAPALMIAPPAGPVRIVNSDAVFVGRVVEIEPIDVDARRFPGAKDTVKWRIAVVKVNDAIHGLKTEKTVRVGFIPFVAPKPGQPIVSPGGRSPQLAVGQDGLFMISKHADAKFYQAPNYGYFVSVQDKAFNTEVKTAKKVVAIMADTTAAMKSKDADERLMAVSIAVSKYRTQKPPFPNKEELISVEESRLILDVLVKAKWGQFKFGEANPQQLFFQLGIGAKDGFAPPKQIRTPDDMRVAVEAWVRTHGDYQIKRFVPNADR